jgi:hypothetical protein
MSETVDSLIVYCRENNRVCPLPEAWHRLWEMLPDRRQSGAAWEPAFPLILAEWHDAPAMLKMVRLAEHIQWAEKHNALPEVAAFLRGLREDKVASSGRIVASKMGGRNGGSPTIRPRARAFRPLAP